MIHTSRFIAIETEKINISRLDGGQGYLQSLLDNCPCCRKELASGAVDKLDHHWDLHRARRRPIGDATAGQRRQRPERRSRETRLATDSRPAPEPAGTAELMLRSARSWPPRRPMPDCGRSSRRQPIRPGMRRFRLLCPAAWNSRNASFIAAMSVSRASSRAMQCSTPGSAVRCGRVLPRPSDGGDNAPTRLP